MVWGIATAALVSCIIVFWLTKFSQLIFKILVSHNSKNFCVLYGKLEVKFFKFQMVQLKSCIVSEKKKTFDVIMAKMYIDILQ